MIRYGCNSDSRDSVDPDSQAWFANPDQITITAEAKGLAKVFWGLTFTAVLIWSLVPGYAIGWDSDVYLRALNALRQQKDPYLDGIARQVVYHNERSHKADEPIPYTYVYSPMTLPFLRLTGRLPVRAIGIGFWFLYFVGALLAIWVGTQAADGVKEKRALALMAPAAIFFPGLLQNDVLFSGNIAYIFYGMVMCASLLGWRKHRWLPFYLVVLLFSCWKAPLLSLLVLPVFSERKQWIGAACTMVAGVVLFALQPLVWPSIFRHYLEAVDLQFRWNHDFGCHPAGVLANALFRVAPYRTTTAIGYVLFAGGVLAILFPLRSRYLAGGIKPAQWWPLLLIGVVLLNPRIMEYDVAAITIPLALVSWRFIVRRSASLMRSTILWLLFLLVINAFAPFAWKGFAPFVGQVVHCLVLVVIFAAGSWDLYRQSGVAMAMSKEVSVTYA